MEKVTCSEKTVLKGSGKKVALLDLGAKNNIAKSLNQRGCEVTIYPASTTAEEILAANPDGIMLSNGPGDPKECTEVIKEIRKLYESDTPIFAICLGHQLMALETGADTHKMKYGHRGGNHPVKDLETGRVYISSQNHGYVVDTDNLDPKVAVPAFINVNDGTNEGLKYTGKNIFTVQFHPEAVLTEYGHELLENFCRIAEREAVKNIESTPQERTQFWRSVLKQDLLNLVMAGKAAQAKEKVLDAVNSFRTQSQDRPR